MNLDARAELRASVKRIVAAAYSDKMEVTVNTKDLFAVMAVLVPYLNLSIPAAMPLLHPEQQ